MDDSYLNGEVLSNNVWSVRKWPRNPFSHNSHQWTFGWGWDPLEFRKKPVLPIGYDQFQIFSVHFFVVAIDEIWRVPYKHPIFFGGILMSYPKNKHMLIMVL